MLSTMEDVELSIQRGRMIREQLRARGIEDRRVLRAFEDVPRESFVPERLRELAYEDQPLPIGFGQTISQPYIVALALEALQLRGDERALDVGTGSGYAAALMSKLAARVYTIERIQELTELARAHLRPYRNVEVRCGDGSLGWPEEAPFDAIAVAAAAPTTPRALLEQLAQGGRLVMPIGEEEQVLVRVTRTGDLFRRELITAVQFVPLIGAQGVPEPS